MDLRLRPFVAQDDRKKAEREEREELERIANSINQKRVERLRKFLPRWFLSYQRFRSLVFLIVILGVDFVLFFILLYGRGRFSFPTVILFLIIYPLVTIADRILAFMALRRVPVEVYYQDESHY